MIAAAGVANLVRGSWLKPGAVVLDVGTCPVDVSVVNFCLIIAYCHRL